LSISHLSMSLHVALPIVLPRGGKNPAGAWEVMKFWTGFDGHERQAAETAVEGGWLPVSEQVVEQPVFQQYLADHPLFAPFVDLRSEEHTSELQSRKNLVC